MQILYTAHSTATGGRDGRAVSSDKHLDVKLSTPKELGGAGGDGTNPEQMFAAGYAACFLSAIKFVAAATKLALPADTAVTAEVGIGPNDKGGFGLAAELKVSLPGLENAADDQQSRMYPRARRLSRRPKSVGGGASCQLLPDWRLSGSGLSMPDIAARRLQKTP